MEKRQCVLVYVYVCRVCVYVCRVCVCVCKAALQKNPATVMASSNRESESRNG